jgi:hypothetical protein
MPYKFQTNKVKLPVDKDRRRKILPEEHWYIKVLFQSGWAIRAIAREYGVDHRTIQFILFPERLEASRANRDWRNYYIKDKHAVTMREHRRYKQDVLGK